MSPRLATVLIAALSSACSDDATSVAPTSTTGSDTGTQTRGDTTVSNDSAASSSSGEGADSEGTGTVGATSEDSGTAGTGGSSSGGSSTDASSSSDTSADAVSFATDVAPILQTICGPNCHAPGGEWPSQDLLNTPYDALVNVQSMEAALLNKVEPGSPEQSYMWHKLNGTQVEAGGSGLNMPKALPGQDPVVLTPQQLDIIETWILEGAQNN